MGLVVLEDLKRSTAQVESLLTAELLLVDAANLAQILICKKIQETMYTYLPICHYCSTSWWSFTLFFNPIFIVVTREGLKKFIKGENFCKEECMLVLGKKEKNNTQYSRKNTVKRFTVVTEFIQFFIQPMPQTESNKWKKKKNGPWKVGGGTQKFLDVTWTAVLTEHHLKCSNLSKSDTLTIDLHKTQ